MMASGGGGGLPSMVSARVMTKEVKGNLWVHWRRLSADGGGKEVKDEAAAGGGIVNFFLGCVMCLWAPRSGGSVYSSNFFVTYF